MSTTTDPTPDGHAGPAVTTELIHQLVPLAQHLGVTFGELSPTSVVATLPASRAVEGVNGQVHGGSQMALADMAAALLAVLSSGDLAAAPVTVQSSTNFLAPAQGEVAAHASLLRPGRLNTIDVEIRDADGALTATVRQVVTVRTQ